MSQQPAKTEIARRKVRSAMAARGLTAIDLAKAVSCSAGTARNVISGQSISRGVMRRIEEFLGIEVWNDEHQKANGAG